MTQQNAISARGLRKSYGEKLALDSIDLDVPTGTVFGLLGPNGAGRTTGLEPRSRRNLWTVIRGLVAEGVTILLTTQYVEEADALADRIGVLDHGRPVAEGTPADLKRSIPGGHIRLRFADPSRLEAAVAALPDERLDQDRALGRRGRLSLAP